MVGSVFVGPFELAGADLRVDLLNNFSASIDFAFLLLYKNPPLFARLLLLLRPEVETGKKTDPASLPPLGEPPSAIRLLELECGRTPGFDGDEDDLGSFCRIPRTRRNPECLNEKLEREERVDDAESLTIGLFVSKGTIGGYDEGGGDCTRVAMREKADDWQPQRYK